MARPSFGQGSPKGLIGLLLPWSANRRKSLRLYVWFVNAVPGRGHAGQSGLATMGLAGGSNDSIE